MTRTPTTCVTAIAIAIKAAARAFAWDVSIGERRSGFDPVSEMPPLSLSR
jgi:hypothetical protein